MSFHCLCDRNAGNNATACRTSPLRQDQKQRFLSPVEKLGSHTFAPPQSNNQDPLPPGETAGVCD
jgi:hypothetical protein